MLNMKKKSASKTKMLSNQIQKAGDFLTVNCQTNDTWSGWKNNWNVSIKGPIFVLKKQVARGHWVKSMD